MIVDPRMIAAIFRKPATMANVTNQAKGNNAIHGRPLFFYFMNFLSYRCEEYFRTPDAISYGLLIDGPITLTTMVVKGSTEAGRIEMLWNANTHIKIYIRVFLAEKHAELVSLPVFEEAVREFMNSHNMSKYSTYEADLLYVKNWLYTDNRIDENGLVDGVS